MTESEGRAIQLWGDGTKKSAEMRNKYPTDRIIKPILVTNDMKLALQMDRVSVVVNYNVNYESFTFRNVAGHDFTQSHAEFD